MLLTQCITQALGRSETTSSSSHKSATPAQASKKSTSGAESTERTHQPSAELDELEPVVPVNDKDGGLNEESVKPETVVKARDLENVSTESDSKDDQVQNPMLTQPDPFANEAPSDVKYKSMAWWQGGMLMIAETISLGILSLPGAMAVLGLIPGLILLVVMGGLASYTGYVIGLFKNRYAFIHTMADAGEVLFGPVGREVLGFGQLLFIIFIMGAHILSFSIMMNAVTDHATCNIVFMVAGTIISFVITLPRTLENLSYYCVFSFFSVFAAVGVTLIGVSITKPGLDPVTMTQNINLFPPAGTSFHKAFLAVTNIVFAYAGHVAFFTFICELREPREFPKALALLQCSDIAMYIVASVTIYYYTGPNVTSPALDSAPPMLRKIAYGLAMPTIVVAGVVNGHIAVKYLYVRMFRNSKENIMHKKGIKSYGPWMLICAVLWLVAWLIAEGVPVFENLLGLTGALFASWFTFGLSGMFWLHLNFERDGWTVRILDGWSWKKVMLVVLNVACIIIAFCICVIGLYASGKSIAIGNGQTKPFSCADNSGS